VDGQRSKHDYSREGAIYESARRNAPKEKGEEQNEGGNKDQRLVEHQDQDEQKERKQSKDAEIAGKKSSITQK